jgi:hypothetical protein
MRTSIPFSEGKMQVPNLALKQSTPQHVFVLLLEGIIFNLNGTKKKI